MPSGKKIVYWTSGIVLLANLIILVWHLSVKQASSNFWIFVYTFVHTFSISPQGLFSLFIYSMFTTKEAIIIGHMWHVTIIICCIFMFLSNKSMYRLFISMCFLNIVAHYLNLILKFDEYLGALRASIIWIIFNPGVIFCIVCVIVLNSVSVRRALGLS